MHLRLGLGDGAWLRFGRVPCCVRVPLKVDDVPELVSHRAAKLCVFFFFWCTVSEQPPLRSRDRETECMLSGGCLPDKGSRTLASHRGRALLIGAYCVEERMLRRPPSLTSPPIRLLHSTHDSSN